MEMIFCPWNFEKSSLVLDQSSGLFPAASKEKNFPPHRASSGLKHTLLEHFP